MERQKVIERAIEKLFADLEAEYAESRKDELGILHNKIAEVMAEVRASPQNVLLVLELLKQEVLQDCISKFFDKPSEKVKVSEDTPEPIKAKSGGSVS
jgi:ParB-like chromosome segregation protein Spo0J